MSIAEIQISNDKLHKESTNLDLVRQIILDYGWNSTSYQVLNPGINHWFNKTKTAVIGLVICANIRVVVGAPVCQKEKLIDVLAEFENDAKNSNQKVCYIAAENRLESIYKNNSDYSMVLLGAQPIWHPQDWSNIIKTKKSLRAQLNRSRNKGVIVSEWTTKQAYNNPQLLDCLQKWLEVKGLPPLHFMVEPNTLGTLYDRRIFVAQIDDEVTGFITLSPVSQRNGWLFEQYVYKPSSPNGTVELMIDFAMRKLADEKFDYVTLGLSPLSSRANVKPFRNPFWIRFLMGWMRLHGKRFYNFDGLDSFKAKLQPKNWEPVFAISNESNISFKTVYAITAAFSENHPIKLIAHGIWRSIKTELKWLKHKK